MEEKGDWTTLQNKHLLAFTHPHGYPKKCDLWEGEEQHCETHFTVLLLFLYVKIDFLIEVS